MLKSTVAEGTAAPWGLGSDQPDRRPADRYAEAVSAYLTQMCGTDRAQALAGRALTEFARSDSASISGAQRAALVRRVVRTVALAEFGTAARRPARRALGLLTPRWRCARTPALLGKRADPGLSATELDGLYCHLARCEACAAMANRCDLAEWHLAVKLAGAGQLASVGTFQPRPPVRVAAVEVVGPDDARASRRVAVASRARLAGAALAVVTAGLGLGLAFALSGGGSGGSAARQPFRAGPGSPRHRPIGWWRLSTGRAPGPPHRTSCATRSWWRARDSPSFATRISLGRPSSAPIRGRGTGGWRSPCDQEI